MPGLDRLGELLERVSGGGHAGRAVGHRRAAAAGPGVELSAYRIIQEALTNACDAPGRGAPVAVGYGPAALDIQVDDDGALGPRPTAATSWARDTA